MPLPLGEMESPSGMQAPRRGEQTRRRGASFRPATAPGRRAAPSSPALTGPPGSAGGAAKTMWIEVPSTHFAPLRAVRFAEPKWRNGRRGRLKIGCPKGRVSSILHLRHNARDRLSCVPRTRPSTSAAHRYRRRPIPIASARAYCRAMPTDTATRLSGAGSHSRSLPDRRRRRLETAVAFVLMGLLILVLDLSAVFSS